MTAAVRACVLSLSAAHADGRDAEYIDWHVHDHLPEQYSIEQVVHGERWTSNDACRAARAVGDGSLDATEHAVQYLFADPFDAALDRFFALGAELREAGRMPISLPPVELGAYAFVSASDSVAPWRPCRGVYLALSYAPLNIAVDGVNGVWTFAGGRFHNRLADTSGRYLTVAYLADDPAVVGAAITHLIGDVLFGAPFVSVS